MVNGHVAFGGEKLDCMQNWKTRKVKYQNSICSDMRASDQPVHDFWFMKRNSCQITIEAKKIFPTPVGNIPVLLKTEL